MSGFVFLQNTEKRQAFATLIVLFIDLKVRIIGIVSSAPVLCGNEPPIIKK